MLVSKFSKRLDAKLKSDGLSRYNGSAKINKVPRYDGVISSKLLTAERLRKQSLKMGCSGTKLTLNRPTNNSRIYVPTRDT